MYFAVKGADKDSGKELETTVEAWSPEQAREIVNGKGILVASVEPVADWWERNEQAKQRQLIVDSKDPVQSFILLQQIANNTRKTAFWVRFWSIASLIITAIIVIHQMNR